MKSIPQQSGPVGTGRDEPCPAWPRGLALGVSLVVCDAVWAASSRHSSWYASDLDGLTRIVAVGCAECCVILVCVLLAVPLALLLERARRATTAVHYAAIASVALLAALGGAYYLASWNSLRTTGEFLNQHSLRMALANPREVWLHAIHMSPVAALLSPLAAAVFGFWTAWVLSRRWPSHAVQWLLDSRARRLACATLVIATLSTGVVTATDRRPSIDPNTGLYVTTAQRFARAWRDRSSPLAHAASQWQRWITGASDTDRLWQQAGVWEVSIEDCIERRPQVNLGSYLERVPSDARRWNVIIILVESLRPDQLRRFGGQRVVMPNVDRLAAESLCFERAYTQASHSSYADLCPLNSQYPLRSTDIHFYPKDPPYPRVLFYDILHGMGYRTAVISSQDERWGQMHHYLQTKGLDAFLHAGNFKGALYVDDRDTGFAAWASAGKKSGKIDDADTIRQAIQWIRGKRDAPFALYLNLQNSHVPYVIPKSYARKYSRPELGFEIGFNSFPPERAGEVKDVYADALGYVDEQLGRLFRFLKDSGEWDRSIIVLTGDTGQAFYEHGFAAHANQLFDEVMRVPILIRAPGIPARLDCQLAQHVDILPTVWELLGLPTHPAFQGRSLLEPPREAPAAYLVVQTPLAFQVGIVKNDWKLILDLPTNQSMLYDLRKDPGERRNVVREFPAVAQELSAQLRRWSRAQLDYYRDMWRMKREYPPVLRAGCR